MSSGRYVTPEAAAAAKEMLKHPRHCREYPGGIRVYPCEGEFVGEFVVADEAGWIPGTFNTPEEAVDAALSAATGNVSDGSSGQSYADQVNAPLSRETLEALRAELESGEYARYRRARPRNGSSGS